jgi:aryl-alcohol dehydrogenase-like predicted oxidoreductase
MKFNPRGRTGINISRLSCGASALGGVYGPVDAAEGIRAVHAALDLGINYFDVAPAYGATMAETVLGKALRGIPRDHYYLSTKVGRYSHPGMYGSDTFDEPVGPPVFQPKLGVSGHFVQLQPFRIGANRYGMARGGLRPQFARRRAKPLCPGNEQAVGL